MDVDRDLALPAHPREGPGDASGRRGSGWLGRTLQDKRCNRDVLLDKDRDRRNKGIRQKAALNACVYQEWRDHEDTDLELLALAFRSGASGERNEGR